VTLTCPGHIEIPRISALARHALPRILEGSVAPVAIFLVMLRVFGVNGAIVSGLAWCGCAIGVRVATGRRVPGILVLGTVTLIARTTLALMTGSAFVYFLQPSLATAALALVFTSSVVMNRPLAAVLAHDFCPLPPDFVADPRVRRVFSQITLIWAATQITNAAVTLWLLLSQSTATFMLARTAMSFTLTPMAVCASTVLFLRAMRRHGIRVTFGSRIGATAAA
jgi:uncharacterized protein DUF3159